MDRFIQKLGHGVSLSGDDAEVLGRLARGTRRVDMAADIVPEGSGLKSLFIVVEGWACRYRMLENGRRQIISIVLPGDLSEPFGVLPRFVDYSFGALTPVTLATVPLEGIEEAVRTNAAVKEALWWDLLAAWTVEREHVVSLGRRSASERLGHLLCELHLRLDMVGLVEGPGYPMPITQTDLADALGLSTVHVNRSLQDLRRSGMISLRNRRLTVHDLDRLRQFSFFDEVYLRPRVAPSR